MRWSPYCQIILMLFIFSFVFLIPAISKAETVPPELCSAPYRGFCTDKEEAGPDGYFEPSPWTEEPTKTGGKRWVVRGKNMVVASCPDGMLGKLKVEKITCPGGCLNGECECLDTDVNDYGKSRSDVKGTTTGAIGSYNPREGATHEDFCTTFYFENPFQIAPGTEDRGSFYPFGTTFEIMAGTCLDGSPGPCYFGSKYSSSPLISYPEFKVLKEKFEKGDESAYSQIKQLSTVDPKGGKNKGTAVIDGSCDKNSMKLYLSPCPYGCTEGACQPANPIIRCINNAQGNEFLQHFSKCYQLYTEFSKKDFGKGKIEEAANEISIVKDACGKASESLLGWERGENFDIKIFDGQTSQK